MVIEAGVKSGSLITADRAAEQGKDVFAVPGDIVRSSFDGTNYLIKNGAKPVFSALDVLSEYEFLYPDLIDFGKAALPLNEVEYVDYRKPKQKNKEQPTISTKSATQQTETLKVEKARRIDVSDMVSAEAKLIYDTLSEEPMHIDDIVRQTKLKMNIVLSSLTELELTGVCELVSGKKYKII